MSITDLWPRRAPGLPPGQREVRAFPRFSDKPLRWAPPVRPIDIEISIEGEAIARLDQAALASLPRFEQTADFHCVTTWTKRGLRWGGVGLSDAIASLVATPLPDYAVVHAADNQSAIYVTDDLLAADVMLATHLDGRPLDRAHGAPIRIVSPSQYGYKNPKHVVGIDFRTSEPDSTLGPKEHLRARVALEERHASLPNWVLRWPYRLTVVPTALAAKRGLDRSPD